MNLKCTKSGYAVLIIIMLLFINIPFVLSQKEIQLDDRDNYARLANNHFQNGKWGEGKKAVDDGLAKYPKDSDLKMLLGKYYFEQKKYDEARYELLEALQYNKNNVNAKQILVNVEMETERYSSAICYINELLEVNPYWKGLWRKKIDIYRLQGNHEEANRLLKRISQIYPDDTSIKTAYLYYIEQEALAKKKEGKIDEAIVLTNSLIEKDPKNENFYLELVNNCLKAGDYEKALINVEKGLYNMPNSIVLIEKKADILAGLLRYDEALNFIQLKIKDGNNRTHLERKYGSLLEEAARSKRKSDQYTLYSILLERNPNNEEAFNYVVTTATANGLYDDALEAIKKAKAAKGETKDLLLREQKVYERMNKLPKVNQIRVRLYQLYPEDTDIRDEYVLYRLQQAKADMQDNLYERAANHWRFIAEYGDDEQKRLALTSIHNCYAQLNKHDDALVALEILNQEYPDESEWYMKKAVIYGKQKKYMQALTEYGKAIELTDPMDREHVLGGYDELAANYSKELVEAYLLTEAMQIIEYWLSVHPQSDAGAHYAINVSAQMNNYQDMEKYALLGLRYKPEDTFFQMKLAEAYNFQKEHKHSVDILSPEVTKNPYHKDLINAHSQSYEDYAIQLIKESKYNEGLAVLDSALLYDPSNKSLKYWKGVAYEKTHVYDSAHYYQSFYEPSLLEVKDFTSHLRYLKNKTCKNEIGLHYLRSRYANIDQISSIATLEYTRFEGVDTYTGRINYAGREIGKGIQGQLEWARKWKTDIHTRIDAAMANKIFSSFMFNGSVYKLFKYDWEAELGAGYRRTADKQSMVNVIGGVSKEWNQWWLNGRINSIILNKKYYYSLLSQARFYLPHPKSYLTAMASFGSAPDVDIIDNQLYNAFSVTNSMVGLGGRFLINETFSAGILGTWYNYEDTNYNNYDEKDGKYRDLYNLYFQLYVSF